MPEIDFLNKKTFTKTSGTVSYTHLYNSMKSGQFNEQNRYRNFNNYVNEKLSDIEYPEQFSHDGISSYEDVYKRQL